MFYYSLYPILALYVTKRARDRVPAVSTFSRKTTYKNQKYNETKVKIQLSISFDRREYKMFLNKINCNEIKSKSILIKMVS